MKNSKQSIMKSKVMQLKDKLNSLNKAIENDNNNKCFNSKTTNHTQKIGKNIEDKVKDILLFNDSINKAKNKLITLNIGGKIFQTSRDNILKDKDSLLAIIMLELEQENLNRLNSSEDQVIEIFIDRNPDYFNIILDFLREDIFDKSLYSESLLKIIYDEVRFYEITDISLELFNSFGNIECIYFKSSGEYIKDGVVIGNNQIECVNDKNLKTGICTNSPGKLTFELNGKFNIDKILVGGFHGNPDIWYKNNGSGASVLVSTNGINFTKVGTLTNLTKKINCIKITESQNVRYIQLTSNSYIGIGYLKPLRPNEDEKK